MLVFIFTLFPILATLLIGIFCAVSDFKKLQIPNQYNLIIIGLFFITHICLFFIKPDLYIIPTFMSGIIACAILFAISVLMFLFRLMGAGDSKMMSAFALFIGVQQIPVFLFYMMMTGAILGVLTLLFGKFKPIKNPAEGSWIYHAQQGDKTKVPYGIAILSGIIFAFIYAGLFNFQTYLPLFAR